jgi:tyrosyl-tRNA synthetase
MTFASPQLNVRLPRTVQISGSKSIIRDPTGGPTERPAPTRERVAKSTVHLTQAVSRFFSRTYKHAKRRLVVDDKNVHPEVFLNNLSWRKDISFLGFLRDVGAQGRIYAMPASDRRESISISNLYNQT